MWNRSPVQVRCMRRGAQGWCTGMTPRDGMGREVGGGFRMGNTCTPMDDLWQCMAKPLQYFKVISLQLNQLKIYKNLWLIQHGWTLMILCQVKETRCKRSHIVWFHLSEILTIGKSTGTGSKLPVARGWGERRQGRYCLIEVGFLFGVIKMF